MEWRGPRTPWLWSTDLENESGGARMTGLIFWMGVVLILAGGLWLASDWFDL